MDQRCAHKKVSLSEMNNAYYSSLMRIYSFLWDLRERQQTKGREPDGGANLRFMLSKCGRSVRYGSVKV